MAQMSNVYKAAAQVIVWLGLWSQESKEALDYFNEVGSTALVKGLSSVEQWPIWFKERKVKAFRSSDEKPIKKTSLKSYFWSFVTQNAIAADEDS